VLVVLVDVGRARLERRRPGQRGVEVVADGEVDARAEEMEEVLAARVVEAVTGS